MSKENNAEDNRDDLRQLTLLQQQQQQENFSLLASSLRPVSSMLAFPLRYNFPPLRTRITSWIVKKRQPLQKKLSAKKLNSR